jgi:hypothetical protein
MLRSIELTAPDGAKVYVITSWVQVVRAALPDESYSPATKTAIIMSSHCQYVREAPDEVRRLLTGAL